MTSCVIIIQQFRQNLTNSPYIYIYISIQQVHLSNNPNSLPLKNRAKQSKTEQNRANGGKLHRSRN